VFQFETEVANINDEDLRRIVLMDYPSGSALQIVPEVFVSGDT